jgi:hypothetical protein
MQLWLKLERRRILTKSAEEALIEPRLPVATKELEIACKRFSSCIYRKEVLQQDLSLQSRLKHVIEIASRKKIITDEHSGRIFSRQRSGWKKKEKNGKLVFKHLNILFEIFEAFFMKN